MLPIIFIDTEIDPKSQKILDLGAIKDNGSQFHSASESDFTSFLKGSSFVCGHNIIGHDIKYIGRAISAAGVPIANVIDTLYLSPLFFPEKPYHALLKDDKLQSEEANNPLNDSIKARSLFHDEIAAFGHTDPDLQKIFYLLLKDQKEFTCFFSYISFSCSSIDVEQTIRDKFHNDICGNSNIPRMIREYPVELAYSLALISCKNRYSITPRWVFKNYPDVERILFSLRNKPCLPGCDYCNQALDIHKGLKRFFHFDSYRTYAGEPLQERAVKAAVNNKSLLAVFPTGGGKSITFQVPALMSGVSARGLTVIISPLQSLMKDQVDNLERIGITDAVTINGLLDPIERAKSFERVEDGSASLLYISPESLRSKTIERLILGRNVVRFVIDEAHCFSSWGQDFRVDYLYIGDFIKSIQDKKHRETSIPVSCFTATAKQNVIEDIKSYFKEKLSLDLELFTSDAKRENLTYKVIHVNDNEEKYNLVRSLIEEKNCPAIVYVSRTKKASEIAGRLVEDGFNARPFYGKMSAQEKTANQNAFIAGEVSIMVATSAFGMGVDKKDVGVVIHYDISDSLENYIQEAGRAGRDEHITADCFVLFNEEDLGKHFILLNQTKLNVKEIQQIWKAIKDITKLRSTVSQSALEIARKAGWDDSIREIETRVTTAISALEQSGYLKRGQNVPRVFASSIMSKTAQEAIDKITTSKRFNKEQAEDATRIIKKLFSSKSRKQSPGEDGESRVDYISDHLGIRKEDVVHSINLLREENILADAKDLTAFIKKRENSNRSLKIVKAYSDIENVLLSLFEMEEKQFHMKELNEEAERRGLCDVTLHKIKTIINIWDIKHWIKRQNCGKNRVAVICMQTRESFKDTLVKQAELAGFIVGYLYDKSNTDKPGVESRSEGVLVEFSVHELKEQYEKTLLLFKKDITIEDVEATLFYLSRTEAIKIEGGFLVTYNGLTIERTEMDNKKRYKNEDYEKLNQFYENRVQQIHIVGEYARKMIDDYEDALQFVDDYFQLNYTSFLNKHFKGSRQNEIKQNITPAKFKQLFGELSPAQLAIIKNQESKYIVVAAGPGSGKTRVLVHKLASLLLMEDVKHEQLLMVTFSRAAVTEFKMRLHNLIGNAAYYIEIKTFHSYCFDLLGKIGSVSNFDGIVKKTVEKIKSGEVEISQITKAVMVIDEAQDMDENEFALIKAMMEQNEDMRVIAVGDDDQNIYEFRGADSKYLEKFIAEMSARKYELIENYRSKRNLVSFTNQFVEKVHHRIKQFPITAHTNDNGKIHIVHYQSVNLITPLVRDILSAELVGTTCVLVAANDEALQVTGLLLRNGTKAKLIQSNDGFEIYNLLEIRFFIDKINEEGNSAKIDEGSWNDAKRLLKNEFQNSSQLEVCLNIIAGFEIANPEDKYKTDLEIFLRESKLEDFPGAVGETIIVSTIHKAKGKEFDNVYLMLPNFKPQEDNDKRQLYVAMTRAKSNLTIHMVGNYLDYIKVEDLEKSYDQGRYTAPDELVVHLSHWDVFLSFFQANQKLISRLRSGSLLQVGNQCLSVDNKPVVRFSKKFLSVIEDEANKGFELSTAKVNFIVMWKNETDENECRIVLPELLFKRKELHAPEPNAIAEFVQGG
jgi:ATP-dependent DNA helicase RecQ